MHLLPRQGHRSPYRVHQNYLRDLLLFRLEPPRRSLRFEHAGRRP
jgi:monooxygenase